MAQQGFEYEKNAAKFLKEKNLVAPNFHPAGAGHATADLEITYQKQTEGCELKITAASAGSLVLKYDDKLPKGKKWHFKDVKGDPEKEFLVSIANKVGALKKINAEWDSKPLAFSDTKIDGRKKYEIDHKKYDEISDVINPKFISDYYNEKKTYYVNVGTHGFYTFGLKEPFGLNGKLRKNGMDTIPAFEQSAAARYRARVQYKGGGSYQFTFELSFTMKSSSPYNIAPIITGTVVIDKKKVNTDCFI
jgi:hypothetical protein